MRRNFISFTVFNVPFVLTVILIRTCNFYMTEELFEAILSLFERYSHLEIYDALVNIASVFVHFINTNRHTTMTFAQLFMHLDENAIEIAASFYNIANRYAIDYTDTINPTTVRVLGYMPFNTEAIQVAILNRADNILPVPHRRINDMLNLNAVTNFQDRDNEDWFYYFMPFVMFLAFDLDETDILANAIRNTQEEIINASRLAMNAFRDYHECGP